MSTPEFIQSSAETKAMTLATPADRQILTGFNLQGRNAEAGLVLKKAYTAVVNNNIKEALAAKKKADQGAADAQTAYEKEAAKLAVPADFIADLVAVKAALKPWHKAATIQETLRRKKQEVYSADETEEDDEDAETGASLSDGGRHISLNTGQRTYTVSGSVMADGRAVFTGTRTYPFPAELIAKLLAIDEANRAVAKAEERQRHCADAKRNIPEVVEGAQADLALVSLMQDADGVGGAILQAFEKSLHRQADANDLKFDAGAVAEALGTANLPKAIGPRAKNG